MKTLIMKSAIAAVAAFAFVAPALAAEVTITRERNYDGYYDRPGYDQPGITIGKHGVSIGAVSDRDRCETRTITKENEYGDRITKTIRHCD